MSPTKRVILSATLACFASTLAGRAENSATNAVATDAPPPPTTNAPAVSAPVVDADKSAAPATTAAPAKPADDPAPAAPAPTPQLAVTSETDRGLRFNFRGAPLEMVLNYLSDAAGFVIVLEADAKGKVDLFSNQPLNKEEAVSLLNTMLEKNGLAAIRNDRTLTIVSRDEAKKRDIPVKAGSDPADIPKNDDIVTQVLPVHSLNAKQLASDLQPLLPSNSSLSANEAGNALVMTDSQANIRRIAEIIKALDTSTVSSIRVFPLKYADAKSLAAVLKEVFQGSEGGSSSSSSSRSDFRSMFFSRWRGEEGGGGESRSDRGDRGERGHAAAASRVTAVADDHSNSVVISAPDDLMPTIEDLIKSVDTNVEDMTEVRVFPLKFADPSEMADLLSSLFPDDTKTDENNRSMGFRFGGYPYGYSSSSSSSSSSRSSSASSGGDQSDRMKKKGRVIAVADRRTGSIVVSAAKDMMTQIEAMVHQLDSNPARKQKVFVYSLENADVQDVSQVLQELFQSSTTANSRSQQNQNNNPLTARQNSAAQSMSTQTSGFGNGNGFGNSTPR